MTGIMAAFVGASTLPPLIAVAAPNSLIGTGSTTTVQTGGASAITVTNGSGTYTYSWVKVSGDAITALTPTSINTRFQATVMTPGEERVATFKCTVIDTVQGRSIDSNIVSVTMDRS